MDKCEKTGAKPSSCWGTRHTLTFMSFLGIAVNYCMRVNMSVAIVAMVKPDNDSTIIGTECPMRNESDDNTSPTGDFEWTQTEQSWILSSFFYGYAFSQPFAGLIAGRYGGKWVFGLGNFITAVGTLLSPVIANLSKELFIVIRVIEGLAEGFCFPAWSALCGKWVPQQERSSLFAVVLAGAQAGTVICLPICGLLADHVGWESIFYVWGAVGCAWFILWCFLVFSSPEQHPRISEEEKEYIISNIYESNSQDDVIDGKLPIPPYKKIITSIPILATIVTAMCQNYGFYTLLTMTPTYLNNIQHFSLESNGFVSALPYLLLWLFSMPWSWLSDWLITSHKLSRTNVRKVSTIVGMIGPAIGLLLLAFANCDHILPVIYLCIACGTNGALYSGYQVAYVEVSPNFAGTIMGIVNGIANAMGIVVPMVVALMVDGNQTFEGWRTVYLIAMAIYVFGALMWTFLGTADVQPWDTYWIKDENKNTCFDGLEHAISVEEENEKSGNKD